VVFVQAVMAIMAILFVPVLLVSLGQLVKKLSTTATQFLA
jgi:hypothetical protein